MSLNLHVLRSLFLFVHEFHATATEFKSKSFMLFPLQRGFFNKSLKKSDFESSDQKSCLDFFSRNDAYSFPENQIFQKRHQINPNTAKWIFFSRNDAPRRSQTRLDFFSKNDASSFPGFSGIITFNM